jgi:hypothetical protein
MNARLARLVARLRGCVEMMVLLDEFIDKKRRKKFPSTVQYIRKFK